ncbi:MAG: A/G-specific adenine glycosylase [Dehalococcoidia bacterium]
MQARFVAEMKAALLAWYAANGRHGLPWRLSRDPYAVLVSEVMLQQTQVERVVPYYVRWLDRWPGVATLAAASPADVIREWAGLGYNRRALHLHRAAVAVAGSGGEVPVELAALAALPGVGPYTASAVACFAGERAVPVIDTNIGRVLARVIGGVATARQLAQGEVEALARGLVTGSGDARAQNLALMDLGAMVCGARSPACGVCPLITACRWRKAGYPAGPDRPARLPAFETTARFARGRIVDALRRAPELTAADLAARLPGDHAVRVPAYLAQLERDGLVEPRGEAWRLPQGG